MQIRIFYRNRSGKDTKIIAWSGDMNQAPANEFQLAVDLDVEDLEFQETNSSGVPTKKIIDDEVADRDQADIDTDINNKQHLYAICEDEIEGYLLGKEKATWLAAATKNLHEYLIALQSAAGVADGSMSVAGQTAKGTLAWIQANVNTPIEASMASRDAAIALLDTED